MKFYACDWDLQEVVIGRMQSTRWTGMPGKEIAEDRSKRHDQNNFLITTIRAEISRVKLRAR
jgi:hypothetical protein